ncbi:exo-alpha-sialidase [Streptomyces sp. NPDC088762]|uniref:exo-alpha-sialidase n=1 Tax=Streptomyces sp. NPDC088762 TaxID=3365891 RepID=UPI00381CA6A9
MRKRHTVLLWAALVALFGSTLSTAQSATAAVAQPVTSQPFAANSEGYKCFRIPQLVHTAKGILAIAEARVDHCGDAGDIDLVAKWSADGKTWESLQLLRGADDDGGYGNPVPVVMDAAQGHVNILYARNDVINGKRQARELRVVQTLDGGKTWSPKKRVLPNLKESDWKWLSIGPGKAVKLPSGPFVVSGEYRREVVVNGVAQAYSGVVFYYSDNGLDWAIGARSEVPTGQAAPTEPSTTVLHDGRIYVNARSTQACGVRDRRLDATPHPRASTRTPGSRSPRWRSWRARRSPDPC